MLAGTGQIFGVEQWVGKGFQDNFLGTHVVGAYVWHVWYKIGE
jgi:hypothetical protein